MFVFALFFLFILSYTIFSFALTDPNLVLTTNELYWNFQQFMWRNLYHDEKLLSYLFVSIIIGLFILYAHIYSELKEKKEQVPFSLKNKYVLGYLSILLVLIFSYNALSHDIFNYAFNAKMVVQYRANPHEQVALDFQDDNWLRFMHNVHTTAPYGYGWTALSVIIYGFGFGKLLPTLFAFKIAGVLSIVFLWYALEHLSVTLKKRRLYLHELALVFLNPLFLIEVVSNYHNDLWMMAPAVLATSCMLRAVTQKLSNKQLFMYGAVSILLLLFSISIKLVTILLLPFFIFLLGKKLVLQKLPYTKILSVIADRILVWATKYVPLVFALLLFVPLFTSRSQQFHPWYLTWTLVWLPFIESRIIKTTVLVFSLSSLLRYVPWLYNSFNYGEVVIRNQKILTWGVPALYFFTNLHKKRI